MKARISYLNLERRVAVKPIEEGWGSKALSVLQIMKCVLGEEVKERIEDDLTVAPTPGSHQAKTSVEDGPAVIIKSGRFRRGVRIIAS